MGEADPRFYGRDLSCGRWFRAGVALNGWDAERAAQQLADLVHWGGRDRWGNSGTCSVHMDDTDLLSDIYTNDREINRETLEQVIFLAVEIAREGREGRKIGTMFVVSETAVVRVFDEGEIIAEIIPELWLLRRRGLHLKEPYTMRSDQEVAVASKQQANGFARGSAGGQQE